jgi:hypothetical protein
MAQFRGTVEGQRGAASRLGGKSSGLTVKANGWHGGVTVNASALSSKGDGDRFTVWGTGGSGGQRPDAFLLELDETGRVVAVGAEVTRLVLEGLERQKAVDALAAGIEVRG